jgi:hypothetical protein
MALDALDVRMARLEGAYEQIDKRLGTLHGDVLALVQRLERLEHRLEQKLDANFRWMIGVILANWTTLMLAILMRR